MTVIAGLVCPHYGSIVADSRLTDPSRPGYRSDVCLKIVPLDGFGAFAWSGSLEALPRIIGSIVKRAARRQGAGEWLLDSRAVRTTLEGAGVPLERAQAGQRVQLLILGRFRGGVRVNPRRLDERVGMVLVETAPFKHQVIDHGMAVLGAGQSIEDKLFKEDLFGAWLHGGFRDRMEALRENIAMKSFYPASRIAAHLGLSEPTVGGLLQVGQVIVGERFSYTPYHGWLETEPGRGVYVKFRWDAQARVLLQECVESNVRVPLLHPLLSQDELRRQFHSVVDIKAMLAQKPGLAQPAPDPLLEFALLAEDGTATPYGLVKAGTKVA
jgi:hypothetical protein